MVHTITAAELAGLVSRQAVDLIDIRDPDEWDTGHIDGARQVPFDRFRADPDAVLAKGTATVFVCAKGVRSMQAAKLAERFGHGQVYQLGGGTRDWSRTGRPLVVESRAAA